LKKSRIPLALVAVVLFWTATVLAEVSGDIGARFYAAVFLGMAPPAQTGTRAEDVAYQEFRARYLANPPAKRIKSGISWEMRQVLAKRDALEHAAASFSGNQIEAVRLVAALPIAYEWEGMAEGPLAEATAAANYLRSHRDSPLKAFIHLFAAQRYRAAAEASLAQGDAVKESECWIGYRKHLAIVLSLEEPLTRLGGDALAELPQVYLEAPKIAVCRETANGVPIYSPTAWLNSCIGAVGEVIEFELDVDGDKVMERFAALADEVGNAGGLFHVFKHQVDGFTHYGSLAVHPRAIRILHTDAGGRPQLERFWRSGVGSGTVDVFVHDGLDFRRVSSRPASAEDHRYFGFPELP